MSNRSLGSLLAAPESRQQAASQVLREGISRRQPAAVATALRTLQRATGQQPAAAPATHGVGYDGTVVYPDEDAMWKLITDKAVATSVPEAIGWAHGFSALTPVAAAAREVGTPGGKDLIDRTTATLNGVADRLQADVDDVVRNFEGEANAEALALLNNSEEEINSELNRYISTTPGVLYGTNSEFKTGEDVDGMRKAAADLAANRRANDVLGKAAIDARNAPLSPQQSFDYTAKAKAWSDAESAYLEKAKGDIAKYPLLAGYTGGDDPATGLEHLASDKSSAEDIHDQLTTKLKNIRLVRAGMGTSYSVWSHQRMRDVTKAKMGLTPWEAGEVERHAKTVKTDADKRHELEDALALGFGLLSAIPTGGSSLLAAIALVGGAAAAGITLFKLEGDLLDYKVAGAATDTQIEAAKEIAADKPDLWWLAKDLFDLGLSLAGVKMNFGKLAKLMDEAAANLERIAQLRAAAAELGFSDDSMTKLVSSAIAHAPLGAAEATLERIAQVYRELKPLEVDAKMTEEFQNFADMAAQEGRLLILNPDPELAAKQVVEAALARGKSQGVAQKAEEAARSFLAKGSNGRFEDKSGLIFLKPGLNTADAATTLAHELTHVKQDLLGILTVQEKYAREYEAFVVQQQLAYRLPPGSLSEPFQWLENATPEDIFEKLKLKYPTAVRPADFKPGEAARRALDYWRQANP